MFDERLEVALGDRPALADLAAEVEQQQRWWGCRKLVIAAAWADAHSEVDHRVARMPSSGLPLHLGVPDSVLGMLDQPVAEHQVPDHLRTVRPEDVQVRER